MVTPPEQCGKFVTLIERILDAYKGRGICDIQLFEWMNPQNKLQPGLESLPPVRPANLPDTIMDTDVAVHVFFFLACEPFAGKRVVKITERRDKQDQALFLRHISEEYSVADKIILIMDNLNTHKPGALNEAYPPEAAKPLWHRFEFVHTPKHGSCLNMAEIELSVLTGQCLHWRTDDIDIVRQEVGVGRVQNYRISESISSLLLKLPGLNHHFFIRHLMIDDALAQK